MNNVRSPTKQSQPVAVDTHGQDLYFGDAVSYYGIRCNVVSTSASTFIDNEVYIVPCNYVRPSCYVDHYIVKASQVELYPSSALARCGGDLCR